MEIAMEMKNQEIKTNNSGHGLKQKDCGLTMNFETTRHHEVSHEQANDFRHFLKNISF